MKENMSEMTDRGFKNDVAVLFDFDGVVMDTETQYSHFWGEQGRKYHPKTANFNKIVKGQTMDQIFESYFKGMDQEQQVILKDLNRFENEMVYDYIPGVITFINDLKKNGVRMAVVTSSNLVKMEKVYKVHPELPGLFDYIVTANLFTHSKPHPECFLMGAQLLDVQPTNCFVFEDSFHGLDAGNAAGMNVVGLATTNSAEAIASKAHLVIDDFTSFTYQQMLAVRKF